MSFFVKKFWNAQDKIAEICQWGAFNSDNEKPEKYYDEYDLLHDPLTGNREQAYRFKNQILCQKLCNNDILQYEFLYHQKDIIELYEYAAIGLSIHHVNK